MICSSERNAVKAAEKCAWILFFLAIILAVVGLHDALTGSLEPLVCAVLLDASAVLAILDMILIVFEIVLGGALGTLLPSLL